MVESGVVKPSTYHTIPPHRRRPPCPAKPSTTTIWVLRPILGCATRAASTRCSAGAGRSGGRCSSRGVRREREHPRDRQHAQGRRRHPRRRPLPSPGGVSSVAPARGDGGVTTPRGASSPASPAACVSAEARRRASRRAAGRAKKGEWSECGDGANMSGRDGANMSGTRFVRSVLFGSTHTACSTCSTINSHR